MIRIRYGSHEGLHTLPSCPLLVCGNHWWEQQLQFHLDKSIYSLESWSAIQFRAPLIKPAIQSSQPHNFSKKELNLSKGNQCKKSNKTTDRKEGSDPTNSKFFGTSRSISVCVHTCLLVCLLAQTKQVGSKAAYITTTEISYATVMK